MTQSLTPENQVLYDELRAILLKTVIDGDQCRACDAITDHGTRLLHRPGCLLLRIGAAMKERDTTVDNLAYNERAVTQQLVGLYNKHVELQALVGKQQRLLSSLQGALRAAESLMLLQVETVGVAAGESTTYKCARCGEITQPSGLLLHARWCPFYLLEAYDDAS